MISNQTILLLETATSMCSVALVRDSQILALKEVDERNVHASHLTLFIDDIMKSASLKYSDLDAVAVSKGPGSYTGLRIGVSTAKGLCFALDVPLLAVDTLLAMAHGVRTASQVEGDDLLVPMIDARRMEVYTAVYDHNFKTLEPVQAKIIDEHSFAEFHDRNLVLFGDGSDKLKEMFSARPNVKFLDFETSAAHLSSLAVEQFQAEQFENVALFEPFYLKDFLVTQPKKRS